MHFRKKSHRRKKSCNSLRILGEIFVLSIARVFFFYIQSTSIFTLPICQDSNGTYSFMWNPNHCNKKIHRKNLFCSDRILTCRIKSIRSPAKVELVVTDLITSPVVSWEGWETPPSSTAALLSFFAQPPAW